MRAEARLADRGAFAAVASLSWRRSAVDCDANALDVADAGRAQECHRLRDDDPSTSDCGGDVLKPGLPHIVGKLCLRPRTDVPTRVPNDS